MATNNSNAGGGIGFFGLLTIVFIVLKLINVINWSWWLLLAPIWIPLAIAAICLILLLILKFKR